LANETTFPHEGFVDFVDNHVDSTTGTLKARGVLPNLSGDLTPGFFASMRVPGSGRYQALLVPDSAVMTDQDRRNLLVVGDDNMVQVKPVQLGALFGNLRAIASGISASDRVIINGQMHARPGAPVAPVDGKISIDGGDFAESGAPAVPAGGPSTESTEPDADKSADASSAAAQLHQMESDGTGVAAATQPAQPIMQYAKPSPYDVTATDFSAPSSAPASEPGTTMPSTTPSATPGAGAGQ
jgi:hypothetical protein